ncbi:hypothetical protein RSAG8_03605, partial [Rhizoctonia solani AG-8 WAC10335]
MSDVGSPSQLRDSMRKMRKRVASVIRRGSSSKNIKSRSGSEEADKNSNQSHHEESDHEHLEHHDEHEHESEHTPSHTNPNSAASSTHSLNKSIGSRPASPQPGSSLSSPTTEKAHRKRSLVNLSFPRSPSKKNKSKGDSAPSSPDVRIRTFSTPGNASPVEPELGKLSIPAPGRPRTLSHPLAASPIMPSSPDKEADNARPKHGHSRASSSPGTGAFGALASAASTLAAMTVAHPSNVPRPRSPSPPSVVLTPPTESPASPAPIVESPSIISPPAEQPISTPDVTLAPNVTSVDAPKEDAPGQPRDKPIVDADPVEREPNATSLIERGPSRESPGQGREPLPREQGVQRAASTVGSEMGWSLLDTTLEEDEPEEENAGTSKAQQAGKPDDTKDVQTKVKKVVPDVETQEPNKVEEVPKDKVASLQTEESGNSLMFDPTPASDERKPLPSTSEGEEHHDGAFVVSPTPSGQGTPQPAPEPASDVAPTGTFIDTPPRESHPTWVTSVSTPPRAASPKAHPDFAVPMTPPAQTGSRMFNPERDGGLFSTPDNQKSFQSSTSPGSSQLSDTPSKFSDIDASRPQISKDDLPSGISTPPRPHETSYYPGDATPPPPSMSESFFHPRNLEKLNPRRLERTMSTMGVFGDADPDGTDVQERLKRATAGPRPSLDTSIPEMISPSVRDENELRKLAGTELRDWYEGETRTPKTVRMMLPEAERAVAAATSRPRSALSQGQTLEPAAEIEQPESSKSKSAETDDEAQPTSQIQSRASVSQGQIQRQPDRAQVYTSVLSRLMSHMDRRSSLMA